MKEVRKLSIALAALMLLVSYAGAQPITNFTPSASEVIDVFGGPTRTFSINVNQAINVSWQINGIEVSSETNVNTSSYSNTSAAPGIWNVSALARNVNGSDMQTWIWKVTQPAIGNGSVAVRIIEKESMLPGESTNITVDISSNMSQALSLHEIIPEGWNLTIISDDADAFKNSTSEWIWSNASAGINKTVIYRLTAPDNASIGTYHINGTITNSNGVIAVVQGDIVLNLIPPQSSVVNATRKIEKDSLGPGESTNITISISSNMNKALALAELIPAGWNFTRISDDADAFKSITSEWIWFNVSTEFNKTVIYRLTAPDNISIGTIYINGTISSSSGVISVVQGDNNITLDIKAYYRRLGSDINRVETTDVLTAAEDWRNNKAPAGFERAITTHELLALIDEWIGS